MLPVVQTAAWDWEPPHISGYHYPHLPPHRHHSTRALMPTVHPSTRTTETRSGTPIRCCRPPSPPYSAPWRAPLRNVRAAGVSTEGAARPVHRPFLGLRSRLRSVRYPCKVREPRNDNNTPYGGERGEHGKRFPKHDRKQKIGTRITRRTRKTLLEARPEAENRNADNAENEGTASRSTTGSTEAERRKRGQHTAPIRHGERWKQSGRQHAKCFSSGNWLNRIKTNAQVRQATSKTPGSVIKTRVFFPTPRSAHFVIFDVDKGI